MRTISMLRWRLITRTCAVFAIGLESGLAAAGLVQTAPDFRNDVVPILRVCAHCHNDDLAEGGLRLNSRGALLKGGSSGRAVVLGNALASLLYQRLLEKDPMRRMPQLRNPLSAAEVGVIRRWIDAGAPWPRGVRVWRGGDQTPKLKPDFSMRRQPGNQRAAADAVAAAASGL